MCMQGMQGMHAIQEKSENSAHKITQIIEITIRMDGSSLTMGVQPVLLYLYSPDLSS